MWAPLTTRHEDFELMAGSKQANTVVGSQFRFDVFLLDDFLLLCIILSAVKLRRYDPMSLTLRTDGRSCTTRPSGMRVNLQNAQR